MSLYLSSLQKFPKSVLYEKVDEKSEKQLLLTWAIEKYFNFQNFIKLNDNRLIKVVICVRFSFFTLNLLLLSRLLV